jgi:hypothetical protein
VLVTLVGVTGLISFAASVVVALSSRSIRRERIELLEGQNADLRSALSDERAECTLRVDALSRDVSHLQGQLDAATGQLGERIGSRIAEAVIKRLVDDGGARQ